MATAASPISIPKDLRDYSEYSDPIMIPNRGRFPAYEHLVNELIAPGYFFMYYLPFKVDLYIQAVGECLDEKQYLNGPRLFFEMENRIFYKITFSESESDLQRESVFRIREEMEIRLNRLGNNLFEDRLDVVKSDGAFRQNPIFPFILFYEYYRAIKFDIINGNIAKGLNLLVEMQREEGLDSPDLPLSMRLKMDELKESLQRLIRSLSSEPPCFSCHSYIKA